LVKNHHRTKFEKRHKSGRLRTTPLAPLLQGQG
jgi:hypothetical protein